MSKPLMIITFFMTVATVYACNSQTETSSEISATETCSETVQLQ